MAPRLDRAGLTSRHGSGVSCFVSRLAAFALWSSPCRPAFCRMPLPREPFASRLLRCAPPRRPHSPLVALRASLLSPSRRCVEARRRHRSAISRAVMHAESGCANRRVKLKIADSGLPQAPLRAKFSGDRTIFFVAFSGPNVPCDALRADAHRRLRPQE